MPAMANRLFSVPTQKQTKQTKNTIANGSAEVTVGRRLPLFVEFLNRNPDNEYFPLPEHPWPGPTEGP